MEILRTIKSADIPKSTHSNEVKIKLLKAIATLSGDEGLQLKLKNEAEAVRISIWIKEIKHKQYKLTRRKKGDDLFAYIYPVR